MTSRQWFALLLLPLLLVGSEGCRRRGQKKSQPEPSKDYARELRPGEQALREVEPSELPTLTLTPASRADMKAGIRQSLAWLAVRSSAGKFPVAGISHDQVQRSLEALDQLLDSATSDAQFNDQLRRRFRAFMSVGCDGQGTVLFTGYCTPIYEASLTQDARFRYPLYKRPADLVPSLSDNAPAQQRLPDGSMRPYPARQELEQSGALRGHELVWLADPIEPYVIQVQGSARLRLRDGRLVDVGNDGLNGHPYHSIGLDLVAEGRIARSELSLATLRAYFQQHPDELAKYVNRNPRFVFFDFSKKGIVGSLNVPVTANVTVATDKSIFPAAAPVLVKTDLAGTGGVSSHYAALRLDQDTGGAIRAPGRCDLYMGIGAEAERRAGQQLAEGRLYYLIVRE